MRLTTRMMPIVACAALAAGTMAATAASTDGRTTNPLRVGLFAAGDGQVEVHITNTGTRAARLPRWQLPEEVLRSDLFVVSLDGRRVPYEGALVKRGVPTAADFAVLRAGETWRSVVDLSATYDMRAAGDYTVTLATPLQYASLSGGQRLLGPTGTPALLKSAAIRTWSAGGTAPYAQDVDPLAFPGCNPRKPLCRGGGGSSAITFVGCSADRVADATQAVSAARGYSENAKGYLAAGTVGPRYTSWFGAYTNTRYATARAHFVDIDAAMDLNAGQITINCGCTENYYAYVYPNRPYEIFVCNAFWSAPMTGTDSKAGTLIHEMSHFNVVAGTDDHAYGQTAARNLATANPDQALNNADNHEYFAENTPSQN